MDNATKFKVGDKVRSAPHSSDVRTMTAVWVAEIVEVIAPNDEGGCYETLGKWEPIRDASGEPSARWKKISIADEGDAPTLRQLWGSCLVRN